MNLTMFSFDGGAPWVVAKSDDAAIAVMKSSWTTSYGDAAFLKPEVCRPIASDEPFTMTYSDVEAFPAGLARDDFECCCGPEDGIAGGQDCCCDVNVTLPSSRWCEILGEGSVTWEYEP